MRADTLRKLTKTVVIVGGVLLAVRAALPVVILKVANSKLKDGIPGYTGAIEDVDLAVWRGAGKAQGIRISRKAGNTLVPFFSAEEVGLNVVWRTLFLRRSVVLEAHAYTPTLVVTDEAPPLPPKVPEAPEKSIQAVLRDSLPFKVDRFIVRGGEITVRRAKADPAADLHIVGVSVDGENLTNSRRLSETLTSSIKATGRIEKKGRFDVALRINPVAEPPQFDLDFKVAHLDLTEVNDFLRAYGGFDAEKGRFDLAAEVTVDKGKAKGYVKPVFEDLKIFAWGEKRKGGALAAFKEAVVAIAAEMLENQPENRLGARVPFEADAGGPELGLTATVGSVLRNVFITAIRPGFGKK